MKKKLVICISGKMRSGKNQFADYLSEIIVKKNYGTHTMDMFAGELKSGASKDFKRLSNILNGEYDRLSNLVSPEVLETLSWMNMKEEQFFEDKTIITRALLQIYGTDIFCTRIDQDYWVKLVKSNCENSDKDIILITDTRFPNELDLMGTSDKFDVISIRVNRDTGLVSDHASENSLDDYPIWEYVIDNNGTLDDLYVIAENTMDDIINNIKYRYNNKIQK